VRQGVRESVIGWPTSGYGGSRHSAGLARCRTGGEVFCQHLISDADSCNTCAGSLAKKATLKLVFGVEQIRSRSMNQQLRMPKSRGAVRRTDAQDRKSFRATGLSQQDRSGDPSVCGRGNGNLGLVGFCVGAR
jgi:hypothetical protein